jgi:hypothetical protein
MIKKKKRFNIRSVVLLHYEKKCFKFTKRQRAPGLCLDHVRFSPVVFLLDQLDSRFVFETPGRTFSNEFVFALYFRQEKT